MTTATTKLLEFNQDKMAVASLIYRNENDLTRGELAYMLGISVDKVTALELKKNNPSINTIINFCVITGNDVYSFFD